MAATEVIQTDYKKFVGIDWFTGANALIPPTGFTVLLIVYAGCVMIATESMADQYSIGFRLIELAVGLIYQIIISQLAATGEHNRFVKVSSLWNNDSDRGLRLR